MSQSWDWGPDWGPVTITVSEPADLPSKNTIIPADFAEAPSEHVSQQTYGPRLLRDLAAGERKLEISHHLSKHGILNVFASASIRLSDFVINTAVR
jgi:hypothetical protein